MLQHRGCLPHQIRLKAKKKEEVVTKSLLQDSEYVLKLQEIESTIDTINSNLIRLTKTIDNMGRAQNLLYVFFKTWNNSVVVTMNEEEAEPQGNLGCSLIVKTPMVNVNTNNEEQNHASQRIDECLFDLNQEFATDLEERMYFTTLEVVTPDLPDVEEVVVEEINDENEDKEQSVEKDEVVIVA
ncbi:hypothetical protein V6N13_001581 [Hibiscus sabdariffa]